MSFEQYSNKHSKTIFINMYNPESLEESVMKLQKEIIKITNKHQKSLNEKSLNDDEMFYNYEYTNYSLNEN